jgi:hypothetical protein
LVEGLLPLVGVVVVWGPPKCGKSFWVFDLVMHIALGWLYRGLKLQQGTVVYLSLEGARGFRARIAAFRQQFLAEHVAPVPFFLVTEPLDLTAERDALVNDIREQIGDPMPAVVVIDTLNRSLVGSESKDADMGAYLRSASYVSEAFGCLVVLIHHSGHDESRLRGHSSLIGNVDAELSVKRDAASNVIVKVERVKDGPDGAVIVSTLEQVEVGTDEDGEPQTSMVIRPSKAKAEKATVLTGAKKIAFELLCQAIAEAGEVPEASNHVPPNTRTCPVNLWRSYCYQGTVAETDKPDTKQKAFVRALKELQSLGVIGVWNDQVWIAGHAGQART